MTIKKVFDIHRRIFDFIIRVIKLMRSLPRNIENITIFGQLFRSVTSMGANDREADAVSTKNDFIHCYTIVRKEANETLFWIQLLAELNPTYKLRMQDVLQENQELIDIVSGIIRNAKKD